MQADTLPENSESITLYSPLQEEKRKGRLRKLPRIELSLSLFWRTFFLLAVLLFGCTVVWLQTFSLEREPWALRTAHQVASLVNLTRAALQYSDGITRVVLIKTITDQGGVRIVPHEPHDRFEPYARNLFDKSVAKELISLLGEDTLVANRVNDEPGLWIGIRIDNDSYWLLLEPAHLTHVSKSSWLVWLVTAVGLSFMGAAIIARFINRPLSQLASAAYALRGGEYDAHRLDETMHTKEIRAVNVSFNRMADRLTKIDQDNVIMLAGISHDLRTPLARLRLETEMSVTDEDARAHMVSDIEQLHSIIDKFLEYARRNRPNLKPVSLHDLVDSCPYVVKSPPDIKITVRVPLNLYVMADETELNRVISNLVENARRYGKTPGTDVADVTIQAELDNNAVLIKVRDRGMGVDPAMLTQLTVPFYRADSARTSATGAGLGLSIVAKSIERMDGTFALTSKPGHGLAAHIRLPRAAVPKGDASKKK